MIFCRYFMTKMIWTLACMKARYVGVDCSRARQFLTVKAQFTTLTMTNIIGSTTQVIGLMERERATEPQTSRMEVYTEVIDIFNKQPSLDLNFSMLSISIYQYDIWWRWKLEANCNVFFLKEKYNHIRYGCYLHATERMCKKVNKWNFFGKQWFLRAPAPKSSQKRGEQQHKAPPNTWGWPPAKNKWPEA